MWKFVLKLGFVFLASSVVQCENPVVDSPLGKVQGVILRSELDKPFYAFRGIPYAKPPIKELRFKPPEPIERWEHVHDATEDGHRCLQFDLSRNGLVTGDENCLLLNVYSPRLPPTTLRSVMVYIHGGGFSCGDGMSDLYGPEKLLDRDVVLVTINYRLSALGFMSTGDSASPGNYGLLDQVQALKWVRDNIAAFGGSPQSVTIFGESAGGASVVFHLLSPLSKGLFHAAIPQSGSPISSWAMQPKVVIASFTQKLAESLNCSTDTSEAIVQCLRRRAAVDVAIQSSLYSSTNPRAITSDVFTFLPIVDEGLRDAAFLPETPRRLLEKGEINKVPVMIGICKDEGFALLQLFSKKVGGIENYRPEDILNGFLNGPLPCQNADTNTLEQRIAYYLSGIDRTDSNAWITAASNLIADTVTAQAVDETIRSLTANKVPTYAYKLTHKGQNSMADLFMASEADAEYIDRLQIVAHGDDLQYLFNFKLQVPMNVEKKQDVQMSDIMLTLWTNFAKNKVPSLHGSTTLAGSVLLEWTPMQMNRPTYLDLNLTPSMKSGVFTFKPEMWKKH